MKPAALCVPLVLALGLVGGSLGRSYVGSEWLIEKGKVGQISLGMTVDSFYSVYGHDRIQLVDLQNEGLFSPALAVRLVPGSLSALVAEVTWNEKNEWIIGRIEIKDNRFETADGIHVGSTFSELKKAYPDPEIAVGGGQVFAVIKSEGISCQLLSDPQEPPTDTAKIGSIFLVK